MTMLLYLPPLLLLIISCPSSGQRYAERNVLPPAPSTYDDYEYEDEDANGDPFGFREEEPNVYKWNVDQYPHPVNTPRFCNRMRPSHVCDPDLVLDMEQADALDDYIQKLYRETPCICETCKGDDGGIVVGIALLKYLHHPYHMHHAKVIRSFAESLRVRWKLGSCDNDILIVVATTDRLSYTDVGRATSAHLSVHEAHRIFLENKAKFSAFNFSEGLMDILRGYHRATRSMRRDNPDTDDLDMGLIMGSILGSVLLLGVIIFLGVILYRRCRRNPSKEGDITKVREPAGSTVSSSWSKKDIKVLFGPEKQTFQSGAKYEKCSTDETDPAGGATDNRQDEDEMDLTLATPADDVSFPDRTQLTRVTSSDSETTLEKELTTATEDLVRTFPSSTNGGNVLVTDM